MIFHRAKAVAGVLLLAMSTPAFAQSQVQIPGTQAAAGQQGTTTMMGQVPSGVPAQGMAGMQQYQPQMQGGQPVANMQAGSVPLMQGAQDMMAAGQGFEQPPEPEIVYQYEGEGYLGGVEMPKRLFNNIPPRQMNP